MQEYDDIIIYDYPIEVDTGEWAENHLDCDTIMENLDQGQRMRVYAVSKNEAGNESLNRYRNLYLKGKHIQKGLSSDAFNIVV